MSGNSPARFSPRKKLVRRNPGCAFRSAIAFGRVRVVTEKDKLHEAIYLLANKYSPDASDESIRAAIAREYAGLCMFALEIEHLTGKEAIELTRARQG